MADIMILQSHRVQLLLLPTIYKSVYLKSNSSCQVTLNALASRPDITCYIQELTVRPNHPPRWANGEREDSIDESWVAAAIELIAVGGGFGALKKFRWGGREIPTDSIWLTLREWFVFLVFW